MSLLCTIGINNIKDMKNCFSTQTPPLGWNSWDCFGVDATEAEIKENALYVAENLKQYGWEYIVLDLGWYAPEITIENYKSHNIPHLMDEYGRLIPTPNRFPSSVDGAGLKPLADYIHSLGLKFGIHIMRGMPWAAAEHNLLINGSTARGGEVVDDSDRCLWNDSMAGINAMKEGAQEYYDSIVELYNSWDVDFIKADDMGTWDGDGLNSPGRTDEMEMLSDAITRSGREIKLSISPGAAYVGNARHLSRNATMWRISYDFWDSWEALKRQFPRCAAWADRKAFGHWPDCDMLPLGKISIRGDVGEARYTNFTADEQYTLMTLWSIFQSPLMFGGHLPESDELSLKLITNGDVIYVNQYGANPQQVVCNDSEIVWMSNDSKSDDIFVALFNITDSAATLSYTLDFDPSQVTELWSGDECSAVSSEVAAHGAKIFRIKR